MRWNINIPYIRNEWGEWFRHPKTGEYWLYHECGVTWCGRLRVLWWCREWRLSAGRWWFPGGAKNAIFKNQTNYAYLRICKTQFEWWMGA